MCRTNYSDSDVSFVFDFDFVVVVLRKPNSKGRRKEQGSTRWRRCVWRSRVKEESHGVWAYYIRLKKNKKRKDSFEQIQWSNMVKWTYLRKRGVSYIITINKIRRIFQSTLFEERWSVSFDADSQLLSIPFVRPSYLQS